MSNLKAELSRAPVLCTLSERALDRAAGAALWRDLARGEPAYEADAAAEALHVLARGSAKLLRRGEDGRRVTLDIVHAPALLGVEAAFCAEGGGIEAEALEKSVVLAVPLTALRAALTAERAPCAALAEHLAACAARYAGRVANLSLGSAEARVAAFLLALAERIGERTPEGTAIPTRLTRRELADAVGVRSETAFRVTGRLAKAGLIAIREGRFRVLNEAALRTLMENPGASGRRRGARNGHPEPFSPRL
ncbi:MAG: Crp/Fnr family transcriptional regulator [Candidatus Methylomirabilis sp.]|nr:Crp/Fnr family transcriptional regulator [Deltaproteobacteria bacterium]